MGSSTMSSTEGSGHWAIAVSPALKVGVALSRFLLAPIGVKIKGKDPGLLISAESAAALKHERNIFEWKFSWLRCAVFSNLYVHGILHLLRGQNVSVQSACRWRSRFRES